MYTHMFINQIIKDYTVNTMFTFSKNYNILGFLLPIKFSSIFNLLLSCNPYFLFRHNWPSSIHVNWFKSILCRYLVINLTWVSVHELFDGQVLVFHPLPRRFPGVRVVVLLVRLPRLSLSYSIHLLQGSGVRRFLLHHKTCELYSILKEERLDRKCFTWIRITCTDIKKSFVSNYIYC